MPGQDKDRLERLVQETAPLEEVAEQFGCDLSELREELKQLGVPVVAGRVHLGALERAFRGEQPERVAQEPVPYDQATSDVGILREQLAPYGLAVEQTSSRRRSTVLVRADDEPRALYSPVLCPDADPADPWGPRMVEREPPRRARVYSTAGLHSGAFRFTASGYYSDGAPDLYFFVARRERRVWTLNTSELRELEEGARNDKAEDDRRQAIGVSLPKHRRDTKGPANALRIWFGSGVTDLDLDRRIHKIPDDAEGDES